MTQISTLWSFQCSQGRRPCPRFRELFYCIAGLPLCQQLFSCFFRFFSQPPGGKKIFETESCSRCLWDTALLEYQSFILLSTTFFVFWIFFFASGILCFVNGILPRTSFSPILFFLHYIIYSNITFTYSLYPYACSQLTFLNQGRRLSTSTGSPSANVTYISVKQKSIKRSI